MERTWREMGKLQFIATTVVASLWLQAPCFAEWPSTQRNGTSSSVCPFLKLPEYNCSDQKPLPTALMDEDAGKSVWADQYASADKCQLWWWAHYAQQWHYPPLTEWAQLLQDAIREGVAIPTAAGFLGRPPKPPKFTVDGSNVAETACRKPSTEEHRALTESLKQFSAAGLPSDLLQQLTHFCMAFEVGIPPWKRLGTQMHKAYVIPLGNVNLAVVSQLKTWEDRALASLVPVPTDTVNNIVGWCPTSEDPRECLEGLIKPANIGLLAGGGEPRIQKLEMKMKAVPEGFSLEGLYGAHLKKTYDITLLIEDGGDLTFTWNSPNGKVPLQLAAFEGDLVLSAPETACSASPKRTEAVLLRPLAHGPALDSLAKGIAVFTPDDFPAPSFKPLEGSKHACNAEPSYGEWAAAVANVARHYAIHGTPVDEIYRFISYQRARWDMEKEISPPRVQKNVVYGAFRDKQLETPLFSHSGYDAQAIKFIEANTNARGKSLLYRTTKIDGISATEVWYYRNGTAIRPLDPKSPKSKVILVHNNHAKEILERSVFGRLTALANHCAPSEEVRGTYIKAMYALFNAVPLQAGEEVVNRVYVAATHQAIFGERLKQPKKWVHVAADAWTMDIDTFAQKYLPLL